MLSVALRSVGALSLLVVSAGGCAKRRTEVEVVVPPLVVSPAVPPVRARCPAEMAVSGDVCVDRWEAHLVTRDEAGGVVPASPYERPLAGKRYEAASAGGVVPQGYVSRIEASAACANAQKRLCTAREWLRACEGAERTAYPYGTHARAGACNSGKPHLMQKLFGGDMRIYRFDAHYNSPKLNRYPGFLAPTGDYPECVSDAGVLDLVGNLHEWVSDPVDASFRKLLTERHVDFHVFETATDGNGVFFGGFYSTSDQNGVGCGYVTPAHGPSYHDYSTGFRCCKDAAAP